MLIVLVRLGEKDDCEKRGDSILNFSGCKGV